MAHVSMTWWSSWVDELIRRSVQMQSRVIKAGWEVVTNQYWVKYTPFGHCNFPWLAHLIFDGIQSPNTLNLTDCLLARFLMVITNWLALGTMTLFYKRKQSLIELLGAVTCGRGRERGWIKLGDVIKWGTLYTVEEGLECPSILY